MPSNAVAVGDLCTRPRNRAPTPSKPSAKTIPAISAPIRPKAGDHGERRPSSSSSGPTRVPTHAPIAKPTRASAPATKPCAQPKRASSSTTPTISQSMPVTSSERTGGAVKSEPLTSPRPRRRHAIANPRRFAPLAATGVIALGVGIATGAGHVPGERKTVAAFVAAWERGDQRAMYALLSDAAKGRTSMERLQRTYNQAAETLTLERVRAGPVGDDGDGPAGARDAHLRHLARRADAPHG